MLFSSLPFLYLFLPAVLLIYFVSPWRLRNAVLLIFSLFFYFCGEPLYTLVMAFSSLAGYFFGLLIEKSRQSGKSVLVFRLSVVFSLVPLLFFKYSDFFLSNINGVLGTKLPLLSLSLPIGISFYTFQILSYLIDLYRGKAKVQKSPLRFMTYVALFPQLIAGPIVRYQTVEDELESRRHTLFDFSCGVTRFCVGLGKKALIADSLFALIKPLNSLASPSVMSYWLMAVAYTLQIYFDFSGYSDMAIGLGRMFGFHFLENFNYPYLSKSVTEFWRRWHISLGSWFRDYVYIPLGGNRCKKSRWAFNILVVWFLTGFWHGASWNFILWGGYFGLLLLFEKLFLLKYLQKLPKAVSRVYTLLIIVFGFVLFSANSVGEALVQLKGMLFMEGLPLTDSLSGYLLKSNAVLLLIAAAGAGSLPKRAVEKWKNRGAKLTFLEPAFCVIVLLLSTAFTVDGSFSPFLYFRF